MSVVGRTKSRCCWTGWSGYWLGWKEGTWAVTRMMARMTTTREVLEELEELEELEVLEEVEEVEVLCVIWQWRCGHSDRM